MSPTGWTLPSSDGDDDPYNDDVTSFGLVPISHSGSRQYLLHFANLMLA